MMWSVLGSGGTIGRRITARLRAAGEDVFTPGRNHEEIYQRPLGHVIYAVGLTADFRHRPYDTVQAHVCLLADLLQRGNFESLLYLSSTRVYARAICGSEDAPLPVLAQDPSDIYNLSKLMGESLCLQDRRTGVRVVRLSNVVGGEDVDSSNFVPSLVREARSGCIMLRSALNSAKDYIHIEDVVDLLPRVAVSGRQRLYNVASGVQITHQQWVDQLAAKTGCAVKVASGAPTMSFVSIDIGLIQAEFNFKPRSVLAAMADA